MTSAAGENALGSCPTNQQWPRDLFADNATPTFQEVELTASKGNDDSQRSTTCKPRSETVRRNDYCDKQVGQRVLLLSLYNRTNYLNTLAM